MGIPRDISCFNEDLDPSSRARLYYIEILEPINKHEQSKQLPVLRRSCLHVLERIS
jgi:hypothetical protein